MELALFGASGTIGQRILREALNRGHQVSAVMRDVSRISEQTANLRLISGDILDPNSVAASVSGHDVVITAFGPGGSQSVETVVEAARSLIAGIKKAGIKRLIIVGGAGSLEVAPGIALQDTPDFPAAWKAIARAHSDALAVYRNEGADLDWTYLSPAALIAPGERTGKFRHGGEQLLTDAQGQSRISAEDYALALLQEVEEPRYIRQRFTIAY